MTTPELFAIAALSIPAIVDLRRWGAKGQIVCEVARLQAAASGAPVTVSYRTIAATTGLNERYTEKLLKALIEDRVIRMLERGAGRRAATYALNPDIDRWLNVRLRVTAEEAMWRLDALGFGRSKYLSRILGPGAAEGPTSHSVVRHARTSYASVYDQAQRDLLAQLQTEAGHPSGGDEIRDRLDRLEAAIAALAGSLRGTDDLVVPDRMSAAHLATDVPGAPCLQELAPLSLERPERETAAAPPKEARRAVMAAIRRATGGALFGQPVGRLDDLLEEVAAGDLVTWCDQERQATARTRPHTALGLLAVLEARAAGLGQQEAQGVPEARVATLLGLLGGAVADGDLETAERHLDELGALDPAAAANAFDRVEGLRSLVDA